MSTGIRPLNRLRYRFRSLRYRWLRYVVRPESITSVSRFYGLRFKALTTDRHARLLAKHAAHEADLTALVLHHTQGLPGDLMLDIGANIGWYSCVFAKAYPELRVLAFEPDPVSYRLLCDNIEANRLTGIAAVPLALSSEAGVATFYQYGGGNRGMNSLLATHAQASERIQVTTAVLDDHLHDAGLGESLIRFVKIDIEGHEYEALRGAVSALRRTQCLLLEYSPMFFARLGYRGEDLLGLLDDAGLVPHFVDGARLAPAQRETLLAVTRQVNLVWLRGPA